MFTTFSLFYFSLGLIFCLGFILTPFLYSYFNTPPENVWVPINNEHRYRGDDRMFAAMVKEARLNLVKYKHACSNDIGNMGIDYTRSAVYRLAAIMSIYIKDLRGAYLVSYTISIVLQYSLLYFLSYTLLGSALFSLINALAVLFFEKVLYYYKERGLSGIRHFMDQFFFPYSENTYFDTINQNFRFIVMGTSGIYIWISLLLLVYSDSLNTTYLFILYFIYFTQILFVYPSVTIASLVILLSYSIIKSITTTDYSQLITIVVAGILALVVLFALGLKRKIDWIRNANNQVLSEAHLQNENRDRFSFGKLFIDIKQTITNIYFLASLVVICLSWYFQFNERLLFYIGSVFFMVSILMGYFFNKVEIINRFIDRGWLPFIFFFLTTSLIHIIMSHVTNPLIGLGILFFLTVPLVILNLRMSIALNRKGAFYMPKNEWNLYAYVNKHVPDRSTVLTLDFSTLQLLPMYTDANLFIRGAEWLEVPEIELEKYAISLKYLGLDVNRLIEYFNDYFNLRDKSKELDEHSLASNCLINTLIYIPFIKTINNIKILNTEEKGWSVDFKKYLTDLKLLDVPKDFKNNFDFIVLKKELSQGFIQPENFSVCYSNENYILLKKSL